MSKSDDLIDVRGILISLWRGKLWIIASAVLFTSLFVVAAMSITPTYRASTLLIPASAEGEAGGFGAAMRSFAGTASLLGLNVGGGSSNLDEAVAVLKSREFLEKFIQDKELMPVLFEKSWDAARKGWNEPDKAPTPAGGYKYFRSKILAVSEDRATELITVSVEWRDRVQAADWTNELIARLNAEMRARALREARESVVFLEAELKRTSLVGVQSAITRIIEGQINKQMLANVTQEYAFRVVERAMPSDEGDIVWPKKKLLAALGLLLGVLTGIAVVLLTGMFRRA